MIRFKYTKKPVAMDFNKLFVLFIALSISSCQNTDQQADNEDSATQNEEKEAQDNVEKSVSQDKKPPEDILDFYNLLKQSDTDNFYPDITIESDTSAFFIVDKKNGFIQFTLEEADKEILQVVLFRDAEKQAILAVNRYSLIENWYTWYIPKGSKPEFYKLREGGLSKVSFRLFDELAPSQFAKETNREMVLPDTYFILPQYGTKIAYVLYPEVLTELKNHAGNWPAVDEGYPPPPDWVADIEAKIAAIDNLKQKVVEISFDKEAGDFYLIDN